MLCIYHGAVNDLQNCRSCITVEVYGNLSNKIKTFQQDLPAEGNTFDYAHPHKANLDGDVVDIRVCNKAIIKIMVCHCYYYAEYDMP